MTPRVRVGLLPATADDSHKLALDVAYAAGAAALGGLMGMGVAIRNRGLVPCDQCNGGGRHIDYWSKRLVVCPWCFGSGHEQ